jgi:hypothetical protein
VVSKPRTSLFVDLIISEWDKMASNNNVHIGKPPHFDGNNYDYWKIRMSIHLRAMGGKFWPIVKDGFVVLKEDEPSVSDNENILTNDQAMNVFYDALDINEFNRIKNLTTAHEIWIKLMEIYEGTTIVKSDVGGLLRRRRSHKKKHLRKIDIEAKLKLSIGKLCSILPDAPT